MFHNIEQNTDEWLALRAGKLTGSAISKVMANDGKAFGEPAKKLAVDIALEQLKGSAISNHYSNDHMQRGHDQEPIARQLYEARYFCDVSNGGFFDNGSTGCSPDGLVGTDGSVEIKCVIPSVQYKTIKRKSYDPTYRWQMVFNLTEMGREWMDYVSFSQDFIEDKKLFVHRLHASACVDSVVKMKRRISHFNEMVAQIKEDIAA